MHFWTKWPYWVRGGVISVPLSLLNSFTSQYLSELYYCRALYDYVVPVPYSRCALDHVLSTDALPNYAVSLLVHAILGFAFGYLYGKVANSKFFVSRRSSRFGTLVGMLLSTLPALAFIDPGIARILPINIVSHIFPLFEFAWSFLDGKDSSTMWVFGIIFPFVMTVALYMAIGACIGLILDIHRGRKLQAKSSKQ